VKLLVVHDRAGNISAVVTVPADAPMPGIANAQPGQIITVVQAPELSFDPTDERGHDQLLRLLDEYAVDVSAEAKLVRKRDNVN
jgi:hypothetical protein